MNETNKDKTWELASAKIHNEATEAEIKELETLTSEPDNKQIQEHVAQIHTRLAGTGPLLQSSLIDSWDKILTHINIKKILSPKSLNNPIRNDLRKKTYRFFTKKELYWTASILLIITFGTIEFLKNENFKFSSQSFPKDEAKIVLSTGEEVELKDDVSIIKFHNKSTSLNINDTIIDLPHEKNSGIQDTRMNELTIPYGKKSELLLADGTKVWINAGSRIAFPSKFTGKYREVFLEGEACFQVVTNEKQPFVVRAGKLNATVLGTLFNISAYDSDTTIETTLIEGSISIGKSKIFGLGKDDIIMEPHHRASYNKENNELEVVHDPDANLSIAWTRGFLEYKRENLKSILIKIGRYYDIEINIPDNYPDDDKISGKLNLNESVDEIISVLAIASGFEYRINGNKVIINKK